MTYTNGYQPQNTGASAYSPFNRSSGETAPNYAGYPAAVPIAPGNPYASPLPMGTDTFSPVSSYQDMDAVSGNIDNKIAQIRQAFATPSPSMAPPAHLAAAQGPSVPDSDIQWALQLEQRVQQGHEPSPQEVARYEDIAARLQAQQNAPPQAASPGAQQIPTVQTVPDSDIQWALQLEQQVQQGHEPNPQEVARYEDIAARLQAQQNAPTQAAAAGSQQAPATQAVPDSDIQWALQLEQQVQQGHEPSPQEVARYEDIATRLQAQQNGVQQPPAGQAAGSRNWADWSQPFSVPAAPHMPLPIAGPGGQAVVNVPSSLRGAPSSPPAAQLNQQPGPGWGAPQMPQQPQMQPQGTQPGAAQMPSQQEIDWALQLEQRVNAQNYTPTQQETAAYENIAQRMMAAQQRGQQPPAAPQQPQMQPQGTQPGAAQMPSQQEIDWALQLEQRVNQQGYQPNPQEMATYESIAQRVTAVSQQPQMPTSPQQPGMQQSGPQYISPQSPPQIPIVSQQYPQVQPQTPQWVMSPQEQRQTYPMPQQPGFPQPGMPQQQPFPQQPGMPQPPAQQSPGFMDRLKNAWGALWG